MTHKHDDGDLLPHDAGYGEGESPIKVIVVWRAEGGWHLETLWYREHDGPIQTHPLSRAPYNSDPSVPVEVQWGYLLERVEDGRGGNAYTWEVESWAVASVEKIAPIVLARAAKVCAATFGPLGEVKGTILMSGPGLQPDFAMPFLLLPDARGHLALVLSDERQDPANCGVLKIDGEWNSPAINPEGFVANETPKLMGAASWRVDRDTAYLVSWGDEVREVVIDAEGRLQNGSDPETVTPAVEESQSLGGPAGSTDANSAGETDRDTPSRYERVPAPHWVGKAKKHPVEPLQAATGEALPWSYSTPWIYRAIASPHTHERVLAAPTASDEWFHGAAPYWHPLLQILMFSLGWARPDRGLRWWYDAGKPVDDPLLRFISDVWGADGQLDWFAAWLWTTSYRPQTNRLSELTGYQDNHGRVVVDPRWIRRKREEAEASGVPHQHIGDGDSLRLSAHSEGPLSAPIGGAHLYHGDPTERRAVLMLDSMWGWYAALARHGATLPDIGNRSWRVEVVVRPVGCLGTFRRSRASRLWFSSSHHSHLPGT